MKLKRKLLTVLMTATVPLITVPAHAGVMAIADMFVSGLGFDTTTGLTGVTISNQLRTGNASATYNGVPLAAAGNGTTGTVDVLRQCPTGSCGGVGENATNHLTPPPSANFAVGDMLIAGAALQGNPIQGNTRANAASTGPSNNGSANATIFNGGSVTGTFVLGGPTTLTTTLFLSVDALLRAWIDPTNPASEQASAGAGYGWTMTVTGSDIAALNFAPSDLNRTVFAVNPASNDLFSTGGIATYHSDSRTFHAGTVYTFAINQSSNASITDNFNAVPEPASLALLGVGLLGLVASRRRKSV